VESAIEQQIDKPLLCMASDRLGKVRRINDAPGRYIEFCKGTFPSNLNLRGLKIVVDCAHGAAYNVAPHVFHELGADVVAIGNAPDGFNINDLFGATAPQQLESAVKREKADIGIALDGDADRLLIVDAAGRHYDGDELLYAIVKHRAANTPVAGVVGTLMTNLGLEQAFARRKIAFERARVGDRYVLELLRERGWLYGGENSGHILCLDKHTTGDGIISALQVLTAMRESGESLSALTADLVMYPQVLLNVGVPRGFEWQKHPSIVAAQKQAEAGMNGRGRVLLRPSGTEPVLRVMVEGEPREAIEAAAGSIAGTVARAAGG
jgi:phosphoglucosamine mutase